MSLHENLNQQFYGKSTWIKFLIPLSYVYLLALCIRTFFYRFGILTANKLPVPVVVIGNITLGGTGKTPLIIAVASHLKNIGHKPGIISRGYKSKGYGSKEVTAHSKFEDVGDEPLMIKRQLEVPVFIGKRRVETAKLMMKSYPEIDIILSDDGLQHFDLFRDYEIAVVDKSRGFGNNHLLPAGPLRESMNRLKSVDAVVMNDETSTSTDSFGMHYEPYEEIQSVNYNKSIKIKNLINKKIYAVTGIGNPERFFSLLTNLGLIFERLVFDDHHSFSDKDFSVCGNEIIVMTEKDSVRCFNLNNKNLWYLSIKAVVDKNLLADITKKIGL
ncbi:MAG: tetraacyldisaccharide 4'-kinase [Methylophilales bacterium]|jgi:tetraacyldisaccharide 4'-kinase|nr:tetraacyldisaccharide 4'-kinase [Pseudomonadota bacterium]NQW34510.1 tetraacyldisaccharide 4'-kinase [Methylophilales bacterium]HCK03485.1 tetraacyldisaccharide 4'-kinase [Methylophilaceae bacterium]|tara:strand:+ start:1820 stop:2806 length:987 start_codon:yes stop_codon:yes gene_type:complete